MLACVYNVKKKNGLFANIDCLFVCFVIRMQIYVKRLFIVCATYHSAGTITCLDGRCALLA